MTFPLFADYTLHLLALPFSALTPFTLTVLHSDALKCRLSFLGNWIISYSTVHDSAAVPSRSFVLLFKNLFPRTAVRGASDVAYHFEGEPIRWYFGIRSHQWELQSEWQMTLGDCYSHNPHPLSLLTSPWPQPSIFLFLYRHLHHLLLWFPSILLWQPCPVICITDLANNRSRTPFCYIPKMSKHTKAKSSKINTELLWTLNNRNIYFLWYK